MMTSMAFIRGVVPLAISSGAGSGSKHAIGTGVIGGMLSALVLAIFWIPLFYVLIASLFFLGSLLLGSRASVRARLSHPVHLRG